VMSMSGQEFGRLEVLLGVQSGRLRIADACSLIGLKRRQVFRLLYGLEQDGAASLISKRRGRQSNHRVPDEVRDLALRLVRESYADFGPTLAAEKLREIHGCRISHETLRKWMIADGLWIDRRHRLPSPHQPRRRRECLGELVQIDGSEHAWFEGRAPMCTLLAFIDDATSRIMALRFVASESALDCFRAMRGYLKAHGKPVAFYNDKDSIFRVCQPFLSGADTAVGRPPCRCAEFLELAPCFITAVPKLQTQFARSPRLRLLYTRQKRIFLSVLLVDLRKATVRHFAL
jgi:transposase InsO family protein